jgi:hypothetical protein
MRPVGCSLSIFTKMSIDEGSEASRRVFQAVCNRLRLQIFGDESIHTVLNPELICRVRTNPDEAQHGTIDAQTLTLTALNSLAHEAEGILVRDPAGHYHDELVSPVYSSLRFHPLYPGTSPHNYRPEVDEIQPPPVRDLRLGQ